MSAAMSTLHRFGAAWSPRFQVRTTADPASAIALVRQC